MPRPKTKLELLESSQTNYKKLIELINSYSKEEIEKQFPVGTLNRNIRDVVAHLHHWHLLLLGWYKKGEQGEKPVMPAKGYTWKTLPDFNKEIRSKYQDVELTPILKKLNKSYDDLQKLIKSHSNEELFEKKRYNWTGSTSLAAYLISNTTSHYNWGFKLIKKSMK